MWVRRREMSTKKIKFLICFGTLCIALTGCSISNLNTKTDKSSDATKITKDQMWHPIAHNENGNKGIILFDYMNERFVSYDLQEKKIVSENELNNFVQYCNYTNSDLYTSGHSTEGNFKIVKNVGTAIEELYAVKDDEQIFPCGCNINKGEYFFSKVSSTDQRKIVKYEDQQLKEYQYTNGNILDGVVVKNKLYYTSYDEKNDYYILNSIEINNLNAKPQQYNYKLQDSLLYEYNGELYVSSIDKIYNIKNEKDWFTKKNVNFFDHINKKLIQFNINTGGTGTVELSIVDLKSKKIEKKYADPISFSSEKGKITIYCEGELFEFLIK